MTKRVNIKLSDELYDWFKSQANYEGVPYSSLMTMALRTYAMQFKTLEMLNKVDYIEELKKADEKNLND